MSELPAYAALGYVSQSTSPSTRTIRNVLVEEQIVSIDPLADAQAAALPSTGVDFNLFLESGPGRQPLYRMTGPAGGRQYTYATEAHLAEAVKSGWKTECLLGYVATHGFEGGTALVLISGGAQGGTLGLDTAEHRNIPMSIASDLAELFASHVVDDIVAVPATGVLVVPKNVTRHDANIWLGIAAKQDPGGSLTIHYRKADPVGDYSSIVADSPWRTSMSDKSPVRFFWREVVLSNLEPDTLYEVYCDVPPAVPGNPHSAFMTLPASLSPPPPLRPSGSPNSVARGPHTIGRAPDRPSEVYGSAKGSESKLGTDNPKLRVMLGSCFHFLNDDGSAAKTYDALWGDPKRRPHLKLLVGDQVYLDAPPDAYLTRLSTDGYRTRFVRRYAQSWLALYGLLSQGSNRFVSDDHEFFNDFPNPPLYIPPLHNADVRKTWTEIARHLYNDVQTTEQVATFDIGQDVSFFILDTRYYRDPGSGKFLASAQMDAFRNWVAGLSSPGVLVTNQILFAPKDGSERALCNSSQYPEICTALLGSQHDLLYLSGDVHFGRIAEVMLDSGKKLVEIVASPMSLVEQGQVAYANASALVAGAYWDASDGKPTHWPQVAVAGHAAKPVSYRDSVPGNKLPPRTEENFFTLEFQKIGRILNVAVTAWRVRGSGRDPEYFFRHTFDLT